MSEATTRAVSTDGFGGALRVTGVADLRRTLGSAETARSYADWAGNAFTKLVRRALRDLALNGFDPAPKDAAIAYGMTLGLQLAAQLMEDPSAVYPDVFSRGGSDDARISLSTLDQTFDTAPDSI